MALENVAASTAISRDGAVLATTRWIEPDYYQAIVLWDTAAGKELRKLAAEIQTRLPIAGGRGHHIVQDKAFSPEGRTLLSTGPDAVRLWNTATGEHLRCFQTLDHTGTSTITWVLRKAQSLSPELFGATRTIDVDELTQYANLHGLQVQVAALDAGAEPQSTDFSAEIRNRRPHWTTWSHADLLAQLRDYIRGWKSDDQAGAAAGFQAAVSLDPSLPDLPPDYVEALCAPGPDVIGTDNAAALCQGLEITVADMAIGSSVGGTLPVDDVIFWRFDAPSATTITLDLAAPHNETSFGADLYGADGALLYQNGQNLDAGWHATAALPEPGRYVVAVRNWGTDGSYRLTLQSTK